MKHLHYEGISRELVKCKADDSPALAVIQLWAPARPRPLRGPSARCGGAGLSRSTPLRPAAPSRREALAPLGSAVFFPSPRPQNSHLVMERCVTWFLDDFLRL